jgi:hypothetical protein
MRHPFYLLYGVLLLGWMAMAAYQGSPLFPARVNEMKNVPKTVRDNPGAYRSIYAGYIHYSGGK